MRRKVLLVAFLGLALVSNLYNLENLFARASLAVPSPGINLALKALVTRVEQVGAGAPPTGGS